VTKGIAPFGPSRPTDYLASERTFLAYVRTSLSVMAFGFVISRFGLFLRMLPGAANVNLPPTHTSEGLGLAFGIFGCLLAVVGVWRFLSTAHDLSRDQFRPGATTNAVVGFATVLLGVAVVASLLRLF
jgi:putative membrane protein